MFIFTETTLLKAVFIAFSVKNGTPAGKKYTTAVVAVVTNMRYGHMPICPYTHIWPNVGICGKNMAKWGSIKNAAQRR